MIKVAIVGVAGRMGGRLLSLLRGEEGFKVVGATEKSESPVLGKDAGLATGVGEIGVVVSESIEEAAFRADVIVDFTTPDASLTHAGYAARTGKAMVIGTTGFSPDERKEVERLAQKFPCVMSPNMSVGVNVMFDVAGRLAKLLGSGFDVEIVEAHHRHKVDSPSGTAIKLAEVVAEALGRNLGRVARFERHGKIGERKKDEIGIQTIRGGDVVGEHTVIFFGMGERIELIHRASSRDNFAQGAIRAIRWVIGKPPGLYTMKDVLGI